MEELEELVMKYHELETEIKEIKKNNEELKEWKAECERTLQQLYQTNSVFVKMLKGLKDSVVATVENAEYLRAMDEIIRSNLEYEINDPNSDISFFYPEIRNRDITLQLIIEEKNQ